MKHLIFDFDCVLGDTYEAGIDIRMIINNIPTRDEAIIDLYKYFSQKPNHTRDHTLTSEELQKSYEWIKRYGELLHKKGFSLFDDFINEIRNLENTNKAIVSSGSQIYLLPAIAKTDIEFTHILAYEDHHSKEEKIEIISRDWGVTISEIYYFTDSLADVFELKDFIQEGKLIGVSWGYCSKEQLLSELAPANILDFPSDLAKIVTR